MKKRGWVPSLPIHSSISNIQYPISNIHLPISNPWTGTGLQSPISILLLTLPAWLPLLLDPGLINTRAGGDSPFLLQRVYEMSVALQGGHFPARWMPDASMGFGYPFWNYYAPLAFYIAATFHLIGLSIVNAIKLTQILGFLGAGAGMYLLADDIFDSRPAAWLATAAYTYAPFHLVNIYVRGDSLGEFVAFAFYPLLFLGLRRLRARPGPGPAAFTAIVYAGLILSHNISALIFTPFAIAYAYLLHVSRFTSHVSRPALSHRRHLPWTAVAFVLGLALSAFYWTPALLEQDAVQLAGNLTGYFHYAGHFRGTNLVQPTLLFNFDVDAAGTPFAMGLIQTILGL
ncbi:MAG: 6-pyruvoyl-tetrahydropterin synthase-related protein, partial [Anaerolineae bacterium]